jgi:hypothetical protein
MLTQAEMAEISKVSRVYDLTDYSSNDDYYLKPMAAFIGTLNAQQVKMFEDLLEIYAESYI